MSGLEERIRHYFHHLTNGQKRVAKYLLDHPEELAVRSAAEIGKAAGVSETTVIRFCHALEYNGYADLQKQIRRGLIQPKSSLEQYRASKQNLAEQPHFYAQVMKKDVTNLERTIAQIREEDLNLAARRIAEARRVVVVGMRTSHAAAHWLSFTLNLVRGNTRLYRPDTDDILEMTVDTDPGDVWIAISLHRYAKATIHIAETIRRKGVFVIGLTDSPVSPLAAVSHVTLTTGSSPGSTIDAAPMLFSLMNALVSGVVIRDRERFEQRRAAYDSTQMEDLFVQEES
ncbi:MAG: MurR/RpiR family transcriptional regulator [Planifilum sp.]